MERPSGKRQKRQQKEPQPPILPAIDRSWDRWEKPIQCIQRKTEGNTRTAAILLPLSFNHIDKAICTTLTQKMAVGDTSGEGVSIIITAVDACKMS